ncbi:MAG: TonB-dependent receptor [Prevotella sp.]|nr:TonB-dependent receptor [Prevotella sp.]
MKRIRMTMAVAAVCTAFGQAMAQNDSIVGLDDIVVTGVRGAADVRHLPMTVSVVGREALEVGHRQSVLPAVVQSVPGLFVTGRGMMGYGVSGGAAGNISLRGVSGGAGQMLVLIDGHPQYQGIYGHSISDSYQTMMAERIEVLRGPASVLYGSNAMGGVMNIVTRGMRGDGASTDVVVGAGSYGTFQADASTRVRSGRFSATVAGQYGRSDNHRPRMGFEQYGGYLKLAYDIDSHWAASVNADITRFSASNPGEEDSPLWGADQWITRGVASVALENHYSRTSGSLSVYSSFGRHKVDDGSDSPDNPTQRYFRSKDALTGVSWYQSVNLFKGNRITVGADYQHIYGRAYYTSKATGEVMDTPNKQSGRSYRNEVAVYADFRQDITGWLTVDAGLRADHHSVTGTELVPQGGIVVRPVVSGELKAMVSKGFRNPSMREMYLYPPSNTDLEPERLVNYELSWKHRPSGGAVGYGVNIFYIKGDNIIETVRVDGRPRNVNSGRIENHGVEAEASWRVDRHLMLTTNHSWLHMDNPVVAAPEYKGFLGADYKNAGWTLHAGLQYVSGLYTAVGDDASKESFCLLNIAVSKQLTGGLSLWARGDNLLAQRYEINAGFPMPRATVTGGVSMKF